MITRELLLLNYIIKKHIEYNEIRVREDQFLISYIGSLANKPLCKYLSKKDYSETSAMFASLYSFLSIMDIEMLHSALSSNHKLIENISNDYNILTKKNIFNDSAIENYIQSFKTEFIESNIYQ